MSVSKKAESEAPKKAAVKKQDGCPVVSKMAKAQLAKAKTMGDKKKPEPK